MNSLLQKHGCANVFRVPEGLKELMSDITREVLRDQPENILEYITNYLSALLLTREHGFLAVKIMEQLCDCKPTLEEMLVDVGISEEKAQECATMIQEHFESHMPVEGDKIKEKIIMKKLLCIVEMELDQATAVCKIMQEVFRDYWQKKMALEETISKNVNEPWEIAAQRTIEIYKATKPTFEELVEAAKKIQAAYRGYHTRREMMKGLKVKTCRVESTTTTLDVAQSRQIDLGPKMDALSEEEIILEPEEEKEVEEEQQRSEEEKPVTKGISPVLSVEKKPSGSSGKATPTVEPKLDKSISGFKEEVDEYHEDLEAETELDVDASRSEGDGTSDRSAVNVTSSTISDFDDTEVDDIPDDTTDGHAEEED